MKQKEEIDAFERIELARISAKERVHMAEIAAGVEFDKWRMDRVMSALPELIAFALETYSRLTPAQMGAIATGIEDVADFVKAAAPMPPPAPATAPNVGAIA